MTNIDYLYTQGVDKKIFTGNYFADKPLGFRIIERGAVVPYVPVVENGRRIWEAGGLVDAGGRFIKSTVGKFGRNDTFNLAEADYVPETVIYIGLFFPIWGHFMTEGLRYFWALNSGVFRSRFGDCPLVYIPCEVKYFLERHENYRRLAELCGVDISKLRPVVKPTRFENIIVPDESFVLDTDGQQKFTAEYRETIDRVRDIALKNRTPAAKKLYFLYGRKQFGEERLAEYFRAKGYEIVRPEKLTVDEQLNLLVNAESFAATLGSCSHNSIFLRDGAEVILIPRAADRFTPYQQTIDQMHALNVNYVDSSMSLFDTYNGPYCFVLSRQLKNFFGDRFDDYSDDDYKNFLHYIKFCLSNGLKVNPAAESYYGEVLTDFMTRLKQREDLMTAYGVNLS